VNHRNEPTQGVCLFFVCGAIEIVGSEKRHGLCFWRKFTTWQNQNQPLLSGSGFGPETHSDMVFGFWFVMPPHRQPSNYSKNAFNWHHFSEPKKTEETQTFFFFFFGFRWPNLNTGLLFKRWDSEHQSITLDLWNCVRVLLCFIKPILGVCVALFVTDRRTRTYLIRADLFYCFQVARESPVFRGAFLPASPLFFGWFSLKKDSTCKKKAKNISFSNRVWQWVPIQFNSNRVWLCESNSIWIELGLTEGRFCPSIDLVCST